MNLLPVSRAKADELEAVIAGRRSSIVATPAVRRLAEAGRQVAATIRLPEPNSTWLAATRTQLLTAPISAPAAARPEVSLAGAAQRWRNVAARIAASARVAVATGTAGALIGSTGVVAAAAESLPGEVLHPVKVATEQIRLALSTTTAGDIDLHVAFARERLDEAEAIAGAASSRALAGALVDLDRHIDAATATAAASGDSRLVAGVASELESLARRLASLADRLPLHQRPFAQRSLAVVTVLLGGPTPGLVPGGPDGEPTTEPAPGPDEQGPPPDGNGGQAPPPPGPRAPSRTPAPAPGLVPELPGLLDGLGQQLEDLLDGLLEDLAPVTPTSVPKVPLDVPLVDDLEDQLDLDGLLSQD